MKIPRTTGRPTKRTPETARIICDCVARGMPFRHACAVARVSPQLFTEWRKDDALFREQIEQATAEGINKRLQKIESASEAGDWRAAAWLLEHCQPEYFAKNRLEVTGADGAPLGVGVQIYLPKKEVPAVSSATSQPDPRALTEGGQDDN